MADPLSISASVTGLISCGLQTVEYLYKYYAACRDQDEDLARIAARLHDLAQSLQIINDTVQSRTWRSDEQRILQHIEASLTRCDDVINELQDEVRKCKKVSNRTLKGRTRDVGRRAAYPFRESTLKKLDEDVNEFRDNLSAVLQALELKEHRNTQDDIQEMTRVLRQVQAQNLTAGVRAWLNAPDASIDFNAACAKRHPGTGQWFIQSATFTTWLEQSNSFRWLYGFAGCGKSVLCATAIQHTFRHQQSHPGSAVAFFFFTFADESKQDASVMLRTLLLQLCGQVSGLEEDLIQLEQSYHHSSPPTTVLIEYLRRAVTRARRVYILLDALDESPAQSSRADVLAAIQAMRRWLLPGLHLLVTSRDIPDVRNGLQSLDHDLNRDDVALRNDDVQEDIRQYVSYAVDHDPQLRRWGSRCEKIKDYLTQRANNVFRWVDCQIVPLRQCPRSVKHLEQCLSTLPQSLDATYERMLCGIGDESRDDARRILSLLCLSPRPLSVAEVIDALAVDVDGFESYDSDRKLEDVDDLSRICPGLIEVIEHKALDSDYDSDFDDDDQESDYGSGDEKDLGDIEYLVSDRIKRSPAAEFAVTGSLQHLQISKTCLIYLCHDDFLQRPLTRGLVRRYPLAQFAAQYWHYHYQRVDNESAQQLTDRATALLMSDNSREHWCRLYDAETYCLGVIRPWVQGTFLNLPSSLYYASLLGLDLVVASILSKSLALVDARGGIYQTALHVASARGHDEIVKILLDHGADVNIRETNYGDTPLLVASACGYDKIVKVLLDHGAEVNVREKFDDNTPLRAASSLGHDMTVRILREYSAYVNVSRTIGGLGCDRTALGVASACGYEKVVQMLLNAGAVWRDTGVNSRVPQCSEAK